ncbi:MAG: invasin domain 3-containing protein [Armatimonadota bacterium]
MRWAWSASLMALCLLAYGGSGTIRLTAYPTALVADGSSQIILTAEVRTAQGKPVPDGTQVAFSTTLGTLREGIVPTEGGVARATLIASQLPGIATITATVLGQGLVGQIQVLMVRDERELRAATDYVQVVASDYLAYANEQRIIAASGKQKGASVQFGFVQIKADDLQLLVDELLVKARHATLRYGPTEQAFAELAYYLRTGEGYGVTEREGRWQVMRLQGAQATPVQEPLPPELLQFADISQSEMVIKAEQIWFYPGERLQFHRAEFYVGAVRVMSLPLYSHSLWGGGVGTDTLIGVQGGRLYLDLPYYYALKPSQVGALRLRTAQRGGRGLSTARGLFLDLEHEYRFGLGRGSFTLSSLARSDWSASWRHHQPLGSATRLYLWLDSPAHRGLFASAQLAHQGRGFSAGLTVAGSTFWEGMEARTLRTDFYLESTPRKVSGWPLRQSLSLNLSTSRTTLGNGSTTQREGIGLRARWTLVPLTLDNQTTLTGGVSIGRFLGNLPHAGWELIGSFGISHALGSQGALSLTYHYTQDTLGVNLLGQHRLSGSLNWTAGDRLYITAYLSRGLDQKVTSLVGDLSWRLGGPWRVGTGITWQQFGNTTFRDQTYTIAYRLGFRELALTWSTASRQWSFDILTVFY